VRITWTMADGRTNAVQAATGGTDGGYSSNFIDISEPIITSNSVQPEYCISHTGDVTTNYLDVGGATNGPVRFYRVRLVP